MIYKFNNIEIDSEKFVLLSNGNQVHVEPKVFNLIVYLIESRNQVVSRDDLIDSVWLGRMVSDTSITNSIKSARKILNDDGQKQMIIKTIRSRGYQFIAQIDEDNTPIEATTSQPNTSIKIWMMTALIVTLTIFTGYLMKQPRETNKLQSNQIKSIAVLPFFNSSPDSDSNYYGFALADQVIGALNYLESITVRPSSTIRKYAELNYDPIVLGEELGVDFILSGHYMIDNQDIRLSAELVNIETNEIVWRGQPINTKHKNTFKVQDILVRQVVGGLKIKFPAKKLHNIQRNIPQNPLAYEYYLRSIAFPHTTKGHQLAIEMLKQSISLDDQYAPSYVQLGNRTRRLGQYGLIESDTLPNTEQYYLKALSINPDLLDAMAYLSMFYTETNRIEEAIKLAQIMYQLNPDNANTHFTLGYIYRYAGLLEVAISEMEKAVELDPKNIKFRSLIGTYSATGQYQKALDMTYQYKPSPFTYGWQALMLNRLGKSAQAIELFDYLITNHPNSLWANVAIIHKSSILGNVTDGLQAIEYLVNTEVSDGETIYYTAAYYGLLGDKKRCLELLRKAVEAGYFNHLNIASNDYLDPVKTTQEYRKILELAERKHHAFRNIIFPDG